MAASEFSVIGRYFAQIGVTRDDVKLSVGDDAALLLPPAGHELAVSIGTQAVGTDFAPDTPPSLVAHRAMATALNRLAASAAEPAWLTLALTMSEVDELWLEAFSRCLQELTARFGVQLVGGDTTAGPLRVTLHAHGFLPTGQGPAVHLVRPGHLVYVTESLGHAQAARLADENKLTMSPAARRRLDDRLQRPLPRVAEGLALRGLASGACSVSDGLTVGLSRLLRATGAGASLALESIPLSPLLLEYLKTGGGWELPDMGPGDFELCFVVPPASQAALERRFAALPTSCTCIGKISSTSGVRCLLSDRTDVFPPRK